MKANIAGGVAVCHDGTRLAATDTENRLQVWSLATGTRIYGPLVLSAQALTPTRRGYDADCERSA